MREKQSFVADQSTGLDPAIRSLAREHRLGELQSVYHASNSETTGWTIGLALLFTGSALTLSLLVLLFVVSFFVYLLSILPGLLILLTGISLLLPKRISARWQLSLWENGFLHVKGQDRQVFRWDQIDNIQGQVAHNAHQTFTFFRYQISRQDGFLLKLNNTFPEIAQFMSIVLAQYSRQVAGQELHMVPPRDKTFAEFTLDRRGISDKQAMLPWQDIQELTIDQGTMAVLKHEAGYPVHEKEFSA